MIDRDTVDHVARLARLRLTEKEAERLQSEMARILEYVGQIAEAGAPAAEAPPARPGPDRLTLRADEVEPSLPRDDVLANAPDAEAGYFRAPAVLD